MGSRVSLLGLSGTMLYRCQMNVICVDAIDFHRSGLNELSNEHQTFSQRTHSQRIMRFIGRTLKDR